MKSLIMEASAGTGKTYSIENKTIELILDGIPLPEILIMTFTEQATSELRKRVRVRIEETLRQKEVSPRHMASLQKALDDFDYASIMTIHGFCNQTLNAYAFETGMPLRLALVDSHDITRSLFSSKLRGEWEEKIIAEAPLPIQDSLRQKDFAREIILPLAKEFQSEDRIIAGKLSDISRLMADMGSWLNEDLLDRIRNNEGKVHGGTLKAILQRIDTLIHSIQSQDVHAVKQCFDEIAAKPIWVSTLTDPKYHYISPEQWSSWCKLQELLKSSPHSEFIRHAILNLFNATQKEKRTSAAIDYKDMLASVRRAVRESTMLSSILKARYRVALVDEFQDTDPVQWDIIRTIFTDDEHGLILVGDPKQSIYSFRGSNVQTYLFARDFLIKGGAEREDLTTNFRSVPTLLDRFNSLFSQGWFVAEDMQYQPVLTPESQGIASPFQVICDLSDRDPLTLVEVRAKNATKAKRQWSSWIADEIGRLLQSGMKYSFKGEPREMDAGDIAILIRNRTSDLDAVRHALRKNAIPYTIGRMTGLFQSDEAIHMHLLLRALSNPHDRSSYRTALLTRFFDIPIESFQNYLSLPEDHPITAHIREWKVLADKRDWGSFFRFIFRDTNLLARELCEHDGERHVTNFLHIAQILAEDAMHHNLDLNALEWRMNDYRHRDFPDDDPKDLQRLETEQRKVNILTLHGSKGLQFPIVFIAGSIGGASNRTPEYFRYIEKDRRVFDFTLREESERKQTQQENAETERLFYVGLTRAQHRVYLPVWRGEEGDTPKRNYITELIDKRITELGWLTLSCASQRESVTQGSEDANWETKLENAAIEETREESIFQPEIPDARARVTSVSSFSHLAAVLGVSAVHSVSENITDSTQLSVEPFPSLPILREIGDEFDTEDIRDAEEKTQLPDTELPKGKHTGNVLHSILQYVNFQNVLASGDTENMDEETNLLINEMTSLEGLDTRFSPLLRDMVWEVLGAPLPIEIGGGVIGDIRARVHEATFWLPFPEMRKLRIPGVIGRESFLTGFIDMFAKIDGRYFIFDWKSNYSENGYSRDALAKIMREHRYLLQGRIYAHAIRKWLASFLPDFSYERDFGGCCYVFLRGAKRRKMEEGIYFWRDEESLISSLDKILSF